MRAAGCIGYTDFGKGMYKRTFPVKGKCERYVKNVVF